MKTITKHKCLWNQNNTKLTGSSRITVKVGLPYHNRMVRDKIVTSETVTSGLPLCVYIIKNTEIFKLLSQRLWLLLK